MLHAVSPAVPPHATARVRAHAERHGWALTVADAGEFDDPRYRANPVDRCYFCKSNLYDRIRSVTEGTVASGTNLDDLGDYRPGLKAAAERGVVHPFVEAGIDKADRPRDRPPPRSGRSGGTAGAALPVQPGRDRHRHRRRRPRLHRYGGAGGCRHHPRRTQHPLPHHPCRRSVELGEAGSGRDDIGRLVEALCRRTGRRLHRRPALSPGCGIPARGVVTDFEIDWERERAHRHCGSRALRVQVAVPDRGDPECRRLRRQASAVHPPGPWRSMPPSAPTAAHGSATTIRFPAPRGAAGRTAEASLKPGIGIVAAGTSDLPIAAEAARTLAFLGFARSRRSRMSASPGCGG